MEGEQLKALQRTVQTFIKDYENPCHEYMKIMPAARTGGNPYLVYMLMHNAHKLNEKMAKDALYLFEITIEGTKWPGGPPKGRVLTPNGMFNERANICTSNGVYHPESYVSIPLPEHMFSMYAAMVTNDKMLAHGIGVTSYSKTRGAEIEKASITSRRATIKEYASIVNDIEEFYLEYSHKWPKLPDGADLERYINDINGQYIELDTNLVADHDRKIIKAYGKPAVWPNAHPKWRTIQIEIEGDIGTVPPMFVVLKKDISDELDNLGL